MDVVDLKEFYAGRLGATARRLIAHRIRARVRGLDGAVILGLGYAAPYLDAWREDAERILCFMPARQGVVHWPPGVAGKTALVDEAELPLPDGTVDFALVIHGLELTDYLHETLRELWRVLSPSGRVLFVVPNRRGMWARFDTTPFGHGRPFSRQQLTEILRDAMFTPSGWAHTLFVPPVKRGFFIRSATAFERVGLWASPAFSGVIMVEAVKQVYATSRPVRARRRLVPKLKPAVPPAPARVSHV
ncbi:methyltransferase domain-containing protein [Kaustia mangrovi]|uniref:Methyltransferase domain-containing protein n=1 Tax=Kaustia mangrovi TaxID=2593653 RepID=A0A7S8C5S2_9HYPH|nr:methyltransferase domain-containing protein [Kaustia mangrovi]QPC43915.1 methyltransferase domain-containing protein [Kaustia mangrovi]